MYFTKTREESKTEKRYEIRNKESKRERQGKSRMAAKEIHSMTGVQQALRVTSSRRRKVEDFKTDASNFFQRNRLSAGTDLVVIILRGCRRCRKNWQLVHKLRKLKIKTIINFRRNEKKGNNVDYNGIL